MIPARPLKVLFAIPELDHGGPDRVVFEVLTKLDRARFTPSLMVSEPTGYYFSKLPPQLPVEVLGGTTALGRRYPIWSALQHVRRTAPDVVFATQRMLLTLGLTSAAFPRGTRLIVRQANDLSADFAALVRQSLVKHRLARQLALASLRWADAVVCQSDAMRDDLRALLGTGAHLHVISNPVDVERVVQSAHAREVALPGRPALVSVGRLAAQKGFDILLGSIAQVRARFPELHLTIFGDGPDRAKLQAQAVALGLERVVTFSGFHAEPLPHVLAADLFVLASRYEGFPNAALEALALGTPVVLTDCPGANSEIVVDGENGRLAGAVDPTSFATALETAIGELARYDRSTIQADCQARFSSNRIVTAYERVISSVAQAARASS